MRIKIAEPGYEGYTGYFGAVEFKDGVSVDDVAQKEINTLAAIVRIEQVDGGQTGQLSVELESWDKPAETTDYPTMREIRARAAGVVTALMEPGDKQDAAPAATLHTQESLEAIADKKGIGGLREIGDKMGVKGTSIAKLIESILNAQGKAPAQFIGDGSGSDAPADSDKPAEGSAGDNTNDNTEE